MNLNSPKMSSTFSVLAIVAIIIGVAQSQQVCTRYEYTPARGLPTISPSKAAAATCNQLFDRRTIAYTPACPQQQLVAVAPADDYKSLLQLARSLNPKKGQKCEKCSKNNCTCGNVKSGEIINKLVDGLIAALVNKKIASNAAKPSTPATPATPAPVPAAPAASPAPSPTVDLTTVTDVVSGVTPVVSGVLTTVTGITGGDVTSVLPTETLLPTDVPSTDALSTDAVSDAVLNSLLSSLTIRR